MEDPLLNFIQYSTKFNDCHHINAYLVIMIYYDNFPKLLGGNLIVYLPGVINVFTTSIVIDVVEAEAEVVIVEGVTEAK